MKSAGWRALLLSLCAIVALTAAVDFSLEFIGPNSTSLVGQWGDTVGASSQPFHLIVLSIDPGHGADLAGVRPGDLIDIRQNPALERFWLFGQPPTGQPVTILTRRGAVESRHTILPLTATQFRVLLLTPAWFGFIWIALFAAIIAWRRSDNAQMRTLCLVLVAFGVWGVTNQHYLSSTHLWFLIIAAAINALGSLTIGFWAACAGTFAPPPSRIRRTAQLLCYALVAISAVMGLLKVAGIVTLQLDPIALSSTVASLPFILACLTGAACTVFAITAAQGAERQRAVWSLVPCVVLIAVGFGAEGVQGVVRSYNVAWGVYWVAAATNIITPMLLTYVAITRRLLDIGFVLNRAAVFAIVSTILIAAFVVVEWVANEWLSGSHAGSAIVGMVVALLLGFSIRYVHKYADRFVDHVLFNKRHESEAELRRFAHEAGFITDRQTLLERALSTVKSSTGAQASFLVLDDVGAGVDENDPALVALRAWHKPIDLDRFPNSALHGQFAFPMVARGELLGALVCGNKADSEVYAPDESEALQMLASGVGSALGLFSRDGSTSNGSLTGAIAELRAIARDLRDLR